ncbi:STN and carboxypeptidase regulatory-like domain-containing protein [Draconibacterium sp. IB214405]|uniref:STN and carboxypeptidase regulatory-like domain-containing protein n=1 Tax=Draconibacterium sp. IB214405 TaxID=3097352 RepID=UPI002A17F170|nr:STN and carboxypeptidase regulatory-like domain-containing protein [Draconibacterium sp. IB214405]MDX8337801.1 STN and carboxypeptidase regulatory-like domain-containing protein [Draconibacterium sp. IB214405]
MKQVKQLIILLTILLLSFVTKGQQQDGSVFERRISIHQTDQTLELILEQISWQANVFFSYDATIIDPEEKATISAQNKSLYTVLNELLDTTSYRFSERQNQVIITQKSAEQNLVSARDTIPVKFFFLSGRLIEERKGKAIQYASVSILNKPVGTISNSDGEFLLKVHPAAIRDTVVISCMGYEQKRMPAFQLLDEDLFILETTSIRIKEVKVTAITPEKLLMNMRANYEKNYTPSIKLMTAFYRETVKQDNNYISVSEAVMEILKAPYIRTIRSDLVRLLKGRKSRDVQPFKWLNFKLMGGPFTITELDAVKTVETFINPEYEKLYSYQISDVIWYENEPVYVVKFEPQAGEFYPPFEGEMYVHRETFALVHANYHLNKAGLKQAEEIMIKKKPKKVIARPTYVHYQVSYRQYQGKWHLASAQASVKFKVRSKRDRINSEFHSVSDLLITNIEPTELKRFDKDERFDRNDIFVEVLGSYDEHFWENYNIIKPNESLRNAFKKSLFN